MRQFLSRLLLLPVRILLWPFKQSWRLLRFLGSGVRRVLGAFWTRLGLLGIAFRNLLTWTIWRPLLFFSAPWRLIYQRWLKRLLGPVARRLGRAFFWAWTQGARFAGWLIVRPIRALFRRLVARWHAGRPGRRRRVRELYSRFQAWRARVRVAILRPRPPKRALVAPHTPIIEIEKPRATRRVTRWATSLVAVGLIMAASVLTAQQAPRLGRVVAQTDYQLVSSKFLEDQEAGPTATPEPTNTPAPTPTPWATPDPLNSGGSVAFTLRQNGNSDIYALSIGQSQPIRLTDDAADDRDPAWSPDGERLAFASRRSGDWNIYVLTLATGELVQITDDPTFDAGPSWSPDGAWLVYESYRHDNLDLYLISADGQQGPLRLTQHPAPDFSPHWSPSGRHIVFTSLRSGNKDLYILSLDEATDDAARNVTNSPDLQEDHASFSPDGSALAYSESSTGFELIYVLPLSNSMPLGEPVGRGQGRHPAWSPEGQALSYIHGQEGQTHLIASSLDAWSVAPQAFTVNGRLDDANWSVRTLPVELPERLAVMNQTPAEPFFVETVFPPQEEGAPYFLQEVAVNAPSPYLSDRVDQSFVALRRLVQQTAGWDFLGQLDNLYEPLEALPLPGQSAFTWNKAGRAFDYQSEQALATDPLVEIIRQDKGYEIFWHTYLRAEKQDGTQGEPLRDIPWDFRARFGAEPRYYDQGGKWKETVPSGYYVDFTTLAADFDWLPVAAGNNWRTFFPVTNYWHYEKRQDLNWEQAMLELYMPEQILEAFSR